MHGFNEQCLHRSSKAARHLARRAGPTRAQGPAKRLGPVLQRMRSIPLKPSWRCVCRWRLIRGGLRPFGLRTRLPARTGSPNAPSSRRFIANPSESGHIGHGLLGSASHPCRKPPASWRSWLPVYPLSWEEHALPSPPPPAQPGSPNFGPCRGSGPSPRLRRRVFRLLHPAQIHLIRSARLRFPALPEPNLTAQSWVRFVPGFSVVRRVNGSPSPPGSDTARPAPVPPGQVLSWVLLPLRSVPHMPPLQ